VWQIFIYTIANQCDVLEMLYLPLSATVEDIADLINNEPLESHVDGYKITDMD
jgi:hypothetical protein